MLLLALLHHEHCGVGATAYCRQLPKRQLTVGVIYCSHDYAILRLSWTDVVNGRGGHRVRF